MPIYGYNCEDKFESLQKIIIEEEKNLFSILNIIIDESYEYIIEGKIHDIFTKIKEFFSHVIELIKRLFEKVKNWFNRNNKNKKKSFEAINISVPDAILKVADKTEFEYKEVSVSEITSLLHEIDNTLNIDILKPFLRTTNKSPDSNNYEDLEKDIEDINKGLELFKGENGYITKLSSLSEAKSVKLNLTEAAVRATNDYNNFLKYYYDIEYKYKNYEDNMNKSIEKAKKDMEEIENMIKNQGTTDYHKISSYSSTDVDMNKNIAIWGKEIKILSDTVSCLSSILNESMKIKNIVDKNRIECSRAIYNLKNKKED